MPYGPVNKYEFLMKGHIFLDSYLIFFVYNAASVAFGFLVLTFSSFNGLIQMAALNAFTMVTAAAGTVLLLPVLINTIKPKFLDQYAGQGISAQAQRKK